MSDPYSGQGQGQQPVVVHVHVHMHNEEKQQKEQQSAFNEPRPVQYGPSEHIPMYDHAPPQVPQRFIQQAPQLALPQPRPVYRHQLPRLVYSNTAPQPLPVYSSQTPRLFQQQLSPNNNDSAAVRYVYREAGPMAQAPSTANLGYRYDYNNNNSVNRPTTEIVQRKIVTSTESRQTQPKDIIFRPGVSEKYVRNVERETKVYPGVRLANMVSVSTNETTSTNHDEVDAQMYRARTHNHSDDAQMYRSMPHNKSDAQVYRSKTLDDVDSQASRARPLREVFTDKQGEAPLSFDLRKPRFPYTFPKTGGLSGSKSMTSLDGKTHDKHVVFENAKTRPVYKDQTSGKTFRIHSMLPIQEEQNVVRRDRGKGFRFYDDTYEIKPMYQDSPALRANKRFSMPAMGSFRTDNQSPMYDNLKRETEEAEQLQSILKNAR